MSYHSLVEKGLELEPPLLLPLKYHHGGNSSSSFLDAAISSYSRATETFYCPSQPSPFALEPATCYTIALGRKGAGLNGFVLSAVGSSRFWRQDSHQRFARSHETRNLLIPLMAAPSLSLHELHDRKLSFLIGNVTMSINCGARSSAS